MAKLYKEKEVKVKRKMSRGVCLTLVACLYTAALVGISFWAGRSNLDVLSSRLENPSVGEVFAKSKQAIQDYEYAILKTNVVEMVGDNKQEYQYSVSGERDTLKACVEVADLTAETASGCIYYINDDRTAYDVYSYDEELDCWVFEELDAPPMQFDLYDMLQVAESYELLPDKHTSEEYGECWVLQTQTSSADYDTIVEQCYISTETYLPMCIITSTMNNTETEVELTEDTEQELQYFDQTVIRNTLEYSHEPMHFYDVPEVFLTAEDYVSLKEDISETTVEEDVGDEEQ